MIRTASLRHLHRLLTAGLLAAVSLAAQAHKASDAYLHLTLNGAQVEQRLDISLRDLERDLLLDANEDGQLQWGEVRTRWAELDALARQSLSLQGDGRPCVAGPAGPPQLDTHSDGRHAVLTRIWTCPQPVQMLSVRYALFAQTDPTHRGIARIQWPGHALSAVLTPGEAPRHFAASSSTGGTTGTPGTSTIPNAAGDAGFAASLWGFVKQGVYHILIGTDHILFLLALLLPAVVVFVRTPANVAARRSPRHAPWHAAASLKTVLWDVFRVVTAFTVAHSITLVLAVLDVINPPSRWIETIIAASVMVAALNNLWPVMRHGRWKLTFAFGLIHGFGFAGALKDLGLVDGALAAPLLGFNLGVELGQLAIVALFLALVWPLRKTWFYRRVVLQGGSVLIIVIAALWMMERGLDLELPWPG
jgi:hypothetical protein